MNGEHPHAGHAHGDLQEPGRPVGQSSIPRDPAQESLAQALRSGFNLLRVLMVVLVVAYVLSGWFRVDPGQQGLVVRFGRLVENDQEGSQYAGTPVFGPGSHPSLPDPFDEKILISGQTFPLRIDSFLFPLEQTERGRPLSEVVPNRERLDPRTDGVMLSGDRNLSYGLWQVEFRIANAAKFVENVGEDPEVARRLLRRLAETAVVQTIAGLPVDRVLRTGTAVQADFSDAVGRWLSEELAKLDTGIVIDNVTAETVEPGSVRRAFLNVTNAKAEKKRLTEEAQKERQRILNEAAGPEYGVILPLIEQYGAKQALGAPESELEQLRSEIDVALERAGGEVARTLRRARARASGIRETLQREYEQYIALRDAYYRHPEVTVTRLWVEMRETILGGSDNEFFYVPRSKIIEILTNRDPQRAIESDIERYRQRYQRNQEP